MRRVGIYLNLIGMYLHAVNKGLLHVLRVEVAQSQSTYSLIFGKIPKSVEVLRILVLT